MELIALTVTSDIVPVWTGKVVAMDVMSFDLNTVIYLLGLAAMWGTLIWRVDALEKKVDKHNNLVERMYKVEEKTNRNEGRIKELEELHPRVDS